MLLSCFGSKSCFKGEDSEQEDLGEVIEALELYAPHSETLWDFAKRVLTKAASKAAELNVWTRREDLETLVRIACAAKKVGLEETHWNKVKNRVRPYLKKKLENSDRKHLQSRDVAQSLMQAHSEVCSLEGAVDGCPPDCHCNYAALEGSLNADDCLDAGSSLEPVQAARGGAAMRCGWAANM
eukprot:s384_g3.t1